MSKVLVTGGAGFIGSHLVDKLLEEGHEVVVIDDLSGGFEHNVPDSVDLYKIDLRNAAHTLAVIDRIKPEIIFHLAANAAENKSLFSPIDITSKNFGAFFNVVVGGIKANMKRFVFTSSAAVYGQLQVPFKETDEPKPEDLYGVSKFATEQSLKILAGVHNFEYVIARPHNVYGPRQNMRDPYRNVVTIFMNALLKNEPYFIYGDGSMKRCFSYIDAVVEALYKCGFEDVAGKTFNIGADTAYSINQLAQTIGGNYSYLPKRPGEVDEIIPDHTEVKKYLGYQDKISLEEGIKRTWLWAKSQGAQESYYTDFEIDSPKIPHNWRVT